MKTKRFVKKQVLRLNKITIVNLNHREMVKVKVGVGEGAQVTSDSEAQCTWCCLLAEETVIQNTRLDLSLDETCP